MIARARDQPRLIGPFVRSFVSHRLAGPMLSRWRLGGVALFHTGRCGSTVLSDLIDQHPHAYWDGETYGRVIGEIKAEGLARNEVEFDPVEYIAKRLKRSGRSWFCYDLKFSHVTEFGMTIEEYLSGIEQIGIGKVIALRRRNYLRQVISARNGSRRGRFHLQQGQMRESLPPLELKPQELVVDLYSGSLLDHFRRWEELYALLEQLTGADALWLSYEDDIEQDPSVAYDLVAEFLSLKRFEPTVRLRRTNPEPTTALLANHNEIREYLADSPYAWMADDDRC